MKISGKQIAAARELLGITQPELAAAAGVSDQTILNFETNKSEPRPATLEAIKSALERRGIEFTNGGNRGSPGDGFGVRLNVETAASFAREPGHTAKEADH